MMLNIIGKTKGKRAPFPQPSSACQKAWQGTLGKLDQSDSVPASLPASNKYVNFLTQFKDSKALSHGMLIHACIALDSLEHTPPLPNRLLQMYAACAAHHDAHCLFASMPNTDVISWNAMLSLNHQCGNASQAFLSFQDMHRNGVMPNRASFLIALSACDTRVYFDEGLRLHFCVMLESMESNVVVRTALLSMYGRCESLEDAWDMFSKMPDRDIIAWNAMIAAYAQNGYAEEGFQLMCLLYVDGLMPNRATFLTLLDICSNYAGLTEGKKAHSCLCFDSLISDRAVGNALINMYSRCGSIGDVREMFDSMVERDVVSWTSMILSLVQHGLSMDALQCLPQMLLEGVLPNQITFISILSACANTAAILEGMKVHVLVVGCGIESHNVIGNALTNMYGKCNCVDLAHCTFARMHDRDVVSWNCIIGASPQSSLYFFQQMLMEAYVPNRATFLAALTSWDIDMPSLGIAKRLHMLCVGSGLDTDVVVVTAVVSMYGKCGSVEEAWTLVDSLNKHDLVLYNAMIAAFSQNGRTQDALQLLHLLQMKGMVPDKATFVSILDACGDQATIAEGKRVHVFITGMEIEADLVLGNTLLTMYGKCGMLEEAQQVFETLPTRDVTTWNALVGALGQCGEPSKAVQHFEEMQTEGITPDTVTFASLFCAYGSKEAMQEGTRIHARIAGSFFSEDIIIQNALVHMYGKCGDIGNARIIFDRISKPDVFSWNALIGAYIRCGQGEEALFLYQSMHPESVNSDKVTLTSILSTFASQSVLADGMLLHVCIVDIGLQSDISVGNALIYMYGKCGSLEDARHVFETMERHDAISWNALIAVYGQHGQARMVSDLLCKMVSKGHVPDKVTLVSILTACSHAGLVEEGYHAFVSMISGYGIKKTIDHYNCMIDLLGRAGRLQELESLIECMPLDPTCTSWMTLLGACNKHFDLERGELAASRVMDLQPQECASFVLLSNIYASAGRWDDATKVRDEMRGVTRVGFIETFSCTSVMQ